MFSASGQNEKALGYKWRSSFWFVTLVVWLGVLTDLLVYSIIVPVIPFQLERLGYRHVSSLTGWLLFAYSCGLVLCTIFVAVFAERYKSRQIPLIVGNVILIGSQIMFMEAPKYWLMCFARALQGVGSTMIWVVGLALICDVTPQHLIGRQLGFAMSGFTIGLVLGPPVGGALYSSFGFRGPFIMGIIFASVDLMGRLLIIEAPPSTFGVSPGKKSSVGVSDTENATPPTVSISMASKAEMSNASPEETKANAPETAVEAPTAIPLTFLQVLLALLRSSRALTAGAITLVFGVVAAMQDTVVSLHLNNIWGLNSTKVGLVMLAAVVPTFISAPLSGWISDRYGTSWVSLASILLAIPWSCTMIVEGPLAFFIVSYALQSFFVAALAAPLTVELAMVANTLEGVGFAHVYSVFNFAFGLGSTIGPIIAGQMYDHVRKGWMAICILAAGMLGVCGILCVFYTGDHPIVAQMTRRNTLLTESKEGKSDRVQ